jgi:hypothetical protein
MPTTSTQIKLIAAARVNAFAGGSPGIQFQSMYGFKSGPTRSSPGVCELTLAAPPKHNDQTVVLVTRHNPGVGEIQANVLSNGRIQINNFDDANVQADSQFSIAVYQAPLMGRSPTPRRRTDVPPRKGAVRPPLRPTR